MGLLRAFLMNVETMLKVPRIQKALQIRTAATETAPTRSYKEKDLAMIHHYIKIANKDVYKKLNMAEFNHLISLTTGRKLEDVDLRLVYKGLDLNKDEYISTEEVLKHFETSLAPQSEGTLAYAFCRFDKDGNDHLYLHELREALFYLGYFHSGHPRIKNFFTKQDTDLDLQINFEEFKHIVKEDIPTLM